MWSSRIQNSWLWILYKYIIIFQPYDAKSSCVVYQDFKALYIQALMPLKYDYAQGMEICDFKPAVNLLCFKYYTISYIIVTVNQMLSTAPLCHLKIAPYMVEYSVLNRLELRLWFSGCCVITGRPPIALSHLTDHLQRDGGDGNWWWWAWWLVWFPFV